MRLRSEYYVPIERAIEKIFRELIYGPLLAVFDEPNPEYHNAPPRYPYLTKAVREGLVWYEDGSFLGSFNARISAEIYGLGGKFDKRSTTWVVLPENVPADVRIAQVNADARYEALRRGVLNTLADIDQQPMDNTANIQTIYERTISYMGNDFDKALSAIRIPPTFTPQQREMIAKDYTTNLDLYIKKWAKSNIIELREKVQDNAFAGRRARNLENLIKQNYGVSQNKAKFLARQETSLLLSKYSESRYADIGITTYKWSTSHDERVRDDHKHLNGKVFSFDEPPITNRKTGARNNPGEDYGCRCVAVPIVK